jgi:hypothetical protein
MKMMLMMRLCQVHFQLSLKYVFYILLNLFQLKQFGFTPGDNDVEFSVAQKLFFRDRETDQAYG